MAEEELYAQETPEEGGHRLRGMPEPSRRGYGECL